MPVPPNTRLPRYAPPTGDAPLDAVEQALVEMWASIILDKITRQQATEPKEPEARPTSNRAS